MPAWPWPRGRSKLAAVKRLVLLALAVPSALRAGKADPGAPLIAADAAYAKAISRGGSWMATRARSVPQSEMFIPERVKILDYGRNDPDQTYKTFQPVLEDVAPAPAAR